ncbi:MAG TPA: ATP-binding protein [Casimicrobiaceae bacterium]|nr:ATP-binding protein [Casimicrobiaceae bacterium]
MSSPPEVVTGFGSLRRTTVQPAVTPGADPAGPAAAPRTKRRAGLALGIRAQLLLVLTVFLAVPWLGYEYVQELERFLRDAQERTLAGTAQAVATALHDRGPLFEIPVAPLDTLPAERTRDDAAPRSGSVATPGSPEIAQILHGLSRTTARIFVVDREQHVLARAGSLKRAPAPEAPAPDASYPARFVAWLDREALQPLYARLLQSPTEDFSDERPGRAVATGKDVEGALAGILTIDRRPTADGKAVIVAAAHPIWVGDEVKGAVIVEETTNAVLAERNRAFARLFNIVLAALLVGSVALTLYASWLSMRIRRLRDEAEAAIDARGRVRGKLPGSSARDEIGDLSRSFGNALARLTQYASYQEAMAGRLSHELRTPIAVVRSSIDNLALQPLPDDARVYIGRAQEGLGRLASIITRMTEATRLEESLAEAERERFDLARVIVGCVDGYRAAYPGRTFELRVPSGEASYYGAPDLVAQMLDKLCENAVEFATPGTAIVVALQEDETRFRIAVTNRGPSLPATMQGRLFDSMVSVRDRHVDSGPHLGLGLYIVRLIAEFHGGRAIAANRDDGDGVTVSVTLPRVRAER